MDQKMKIEAESPKFIRELKETYLTSRIKGFFDMMAFRADESDLAYAEAKFCKHFLKFLKLKRKIEGLRPEDLKKKSTMRLIAKAIHTQTILDNLLVEIKNRKGGDQNV